MLVTNWLTVRSTTASNDATKQTASTSGMGSAITRRPTLEFGQNLEISKVGIANPVPTTYVAREL